MNHHMISDHARIKRIKGAIVLLVLTLNCSQAFSAGTAFDAFSISGLGSVQAGQAAEASDPSVLFSNPAALTRFRRAEVSQGAAVIAVNNSYTSLQNNDGAPTTSGTTGSTGDVFDRKSGPDATALAPTAYIAIPINNKFVIGFGASASHALLLRYQEDFPGRNLGRDIDFKVIRLNSGFGYKLSPTLSLGMNASYERYYQKVVLKFNYENAVNRVLGNENASDLVNVLTTVPEEANAKLRMFGWALNAQFGALWEPSERTRVGISYRPKTPFSNQGKFQIDESDEGTEFREFLAAPINQPLFGLIGVDGQQLASDLEPDQAMDQNIVLPSELRVSAFHHLNPKWDVMATYTLQDFSVTELAFYRQKDGRLLIDIPLDFKAAQSYRLGVNYRIYNRLTLKAGFAYETSVVDDQRRTPILADNDRYFLGLGADYAIDRDNTISVGLMHLRVKEALVGLNTENIEPEEVRGGDFLGNVNLNATYAGISLQSKW